MDNIKKHHQESESIMEKLEIQLDEILAKKKKEITQSLEEKIKMEKVEAEKQLSQIEESYKKEKESLGTYKSLYAEIEQKNLEFNEKIKVHLNKATSYQETISELTSKTLAELRAISQISREMQEYRETSETEMSVIRKDLEEKYGIKTADTQTGSQDDLDFNLDQELSKLSKIKELLGGRGREQEQDQVVEHHNDMIPEVEALEQVDPANTFEVSDEDVDVEYQPHFETTGEDSSLPEQETEETSEVLEYLPDEGEDPISSTQMNNGSGLQEVPAADFEIETAPAVIEYEIAEEMEAEDTQPEIVPVPLNQNGEEDGISSILNDSYQELQRLDEMKSETNFEDVFEELETYRKGSCTEDNGDVSYFQKKERIIIDGECLISTLNNSLEGAKKLYSRLGETESPKEQFFIKQDIIRFQEILRKLMLVTIRMCEKEDCSLPKYTLEILNVDILKNILEKVSMENWSDQSDFATFDDYAKSLKDAYYSRITPPAIYLKDIIEELEMS
ncbi:MAG: hypothetical protein ABIJ35_06375 [Acidobacteriota bacterium]